MLLCRKGDLMKTRVVTLHYTLTDKTGKTLDSSSGGDPLVYIEGMGSIIAGLDTEVQKLQTGDKKKIVVAAQDAYGMMDESLVMEVPKTQFPSDHPLKVGDKFRAGNSHHSPVFTIKHITETHVKIDGNHPLAGEELSFDVEVVETRDATMEELEHGHVHGPGGHHHH